MKENKWVEEKLLNGSLIWVRGSDTVHPTGGEFVISGGDTWLPGCFTTLEAAKLAFDYPIEQISDLQKRKNIEAGGSGGSITEADLKSLGHTT